MPSRAQLRWVARGSAVVLSLAMTTGLLASDHHAASAPLASRERIASSTTTAAAAPARTPPPPTTTSLTIAPRAAVRVTATPTTARVHVTTTTRPPAPVVQAAAAPTDTVASRGEQALARINYPWQKLGYTISFEPGQDGYLGLTASDTRTIHIYVRGDESLDTLARAKGHEMGHALDFSHIDDAQRQQYIGIRGINATLDTWYACNGCTDYSTAAGDWAETFQYWLLGPGQYYSQMGPPPDADQLAQLSSLFTLP